MPTPFRMPLRVTSTSTLSHDIVLTSNIVADAQSATPLAMLSNPTKLDAAGNPHVEALAIVSQSVHNVATPQLCHVARSSASESGWALTPLFTTIQPVEVAAGTHRLGAPFAAVHGFFTDAKNLYFSTLQADGTTWAPPTTVATSNGTSSGILNLQVTYSPAGAMVVYGNTSDGNLITVTPQIATGIAPAVTICDLGGVLLGADYRLCLSSESNWYLTVGSTTQPTLYVGTLTGTKPETQEAVGVLKDSPGNVALGYWSHASGQTPSAIWLFVNATHQLQIWSMGMGGSTSGEIVPTGNIYLSEATGYVSAADGTLHVYFIDTTSAAGLWVLHQYPGDQGWDDNGVPQFAPAIPLGTGVGNLVCDSNPRSNASFFSLSAADYSLQLHNQDATSQLWRTTSLATPTAETYELVRYRTEFTLVDAGGNPVGNYPVTLNTAAGNSACELAVLGNLVGVGATPVTVRTDGSGRLTVALLATTNLAAPSLELNAEGLAALYSVELAGPTHAYLAGHLTSYNPTNPSGPLPVFDQAGNALRNAKTPGGAPLYDPATQAPPATAAAAIAMGAQVGTGTQPAGLAGFQVAAPGYGGEQGIRLFHSPEELAAFQQLMPPVLGDIWDDISDFFGDLWEGIKNGLIQIKNAVVSVADKIATFTLQLGQEIAQDVKMGIETLEKAAHFIAGVFQWIGAAIEKVIDWLKALFDFAAIVRTARVFETALLSLPTYITKLLTTWDLHLDTWFTDQEAAVAAAFAALKAKYAGTSFSELSNFHSPGDGGSSPAIGNASTGDFTSNVHHHWLADKVDASAGTTSPATGATGLQAPWDAFRAHLQASSGDFDKALDDFKTFFINIVAQPQNFVSLGIPAFLDMVQDLIEALLELCNAVADGFFAMGTAFMAALNDLLTTTIDIVPLQALWSFLAGADAPPLTIATLLSVLAAFPTTVIYKLLVGVDNEPFPEGVNPFASAAGRAATQGAAGPGAGSTMPPACLITAGIVQILGVFPAAISDALGDEAPWQLTLASVADAGLIFLLTNGNLTLDYVGVPLVGIVGLVAGILINTGKVTIPTLADDSKDALNALLTLYGFCKLSYGLHEAVNGDEDALQQAESLLLPLPTIFSFLRSSEYRDNPDVAPFAIAGNFFFDFVGYVGTGACEVIDAMNKLGDAPAHPELLHA